MPNYVTLIVMAVAFWLGIYGSFRLAQQTLAANRAAWPDFEKSGRLSPPVIHWLIAQMRDDVGGLLNAVTITNGLLAAIVAGMAIHLLR